MTNPDKIKALHAIRDANTGVSGKAQRVRLRAALAMFPLNTFECSRYLDVYDPRARLRDLRDAGDEIDRHWAYIETECGEVHRIGVYTLRQAASLEVAP